MSCFFIFILQPHFQNSWENWDLKIDTTATILDIDVNNHVNNTNYVRWILSYLPEEVQKGKLVSTLDTYFIAQAMMGDQLEICSGIDKEKSIFNSENAADNVTVVCHSIIRKSDGAEIFRARTEWKDEHLLARNVG